MFFLRGALRMAREPALKKFANGMLRRLLAYNRSFKRRKAPRWRGTAVILDIGDAMVAAT